MSLENEKSLFQQSKIKLDDVNNQSQCTNPFSSSKKTDIIWMLTLTNYVTMSKLFNVLSLFSHSLRGTDTTYL